MKYGLYNPLTQYLSHIVKDDPMIYIYIQYIYNVNVNVNVHVNVNVNVII